MKSIRRKKEKGVFSISKDRTHSCWRGHHFTLMELMVVFLFLSMMMGVVAIPLKKAYDEQCFHSDVKKMVQQLSLAQDLMLMANVDVICHLAYQEKTGVLESWLEIEQPLSPHLAKIAEGRCQLPAIKVFTFKEREHLKLALHFVWGSMSKGVLNLHSQRSHRLSDAAAVAVKKAEIVLPGYPSPLPFRGALIKDLALRSEWIYPEKLYHEFNTSK